MDKILPPQPGQGPAPYGDFGKEEKAAKEVQGGGGKIRILIVDDDAVQFMLTKRGLRGGNYEFTEASSGPGALEVFEKDKFDLVITDYKMTGMFGDELAVELRGLDPDVPIIMQSGEHPILLHDPEILELIEQGVIHGVFDKIDYEGIAPAITELTGQKDVNTG